MGDILQRIRERFGDQVLTEDPRGTPPTVDVRRDRIADLLRFLRDDPEASFDCLTDLCGVDHLDRGAPARFAVVYHLFSFAHRRLLRVRAWVPEEDPGIDTASAVWPAADWAEREAFDMYGIRFRGHPNLVRILLPDGYEGHPLRKDYPLTGRGERDRFPRYVP
jgi:NADH-quinone oxidoreductase subunit C